jgi:hypothetical protein
VCKHGHNTCVNVSKDIADSEMGLIYPALLTRGLPPARFLAAINAELQQSTAAAGNAISFHLTSLPGQLPRASVGGRVGTVTEQGHAGALPAPDRTALATTQIVLFMYGTPAAHFTADGELLSRIGSCYGPEPRTLYRMYMDQGFVAPVLLGWKVPSEQQNALIISGNGHRAVAADMFAVTPGAPAIAGGTVTQEIMEFADRYSGHPVRGDLP